MNVLIPMESEFEELKKILNHACFTRPKVSDWSTYEHIDHILKVNSSLLKLLSENNPVTTKKISLIGRLVLLTGYIPRGKAKAPESVLPKKKTNEELINELNLIEDQFINTRVDKKSKDIIFDHPFLGGMNQAQTLKFMLVHQKHHLKIIKDIYSNNG